MTIASSRTTINDIARIAGVSKKTVSRVINQSPLLSDATRARVEAVIAETGFVPNAQARALALRRNFLIALVHDGSDRGVLDAVQTGMAAALAESELALVLQYVPAPDAALRLRAFLDRHRPTGVVLIPPLSEDEDLAALCDEAQVRCVRLGRVRGRHGLGCDDRGAMAGLVEWLIDQGHRRIGLVGGPETSLNAQQRELGYLDAMADHGLDRGPSLIVPGDNSFASGMAAGRLLLEVSPRPSAVIACNDEMAVGVLHAASEAGVPVPLRLSIVGFDDTRLAARTWPPLTSVHVPWEEMGREAIVRISAAHQDSGPIVPFQAELVQRGSVAAHGVHLNTASGSSLQSG